MGSVARLISPSVSTHTGRRAYDLQLDVDAHSALEFGTHCMSLRKKPVYPRLVFVALRADGSDRVEVSTRALVRKCHDYNARFAELDGELRVNPEQVHMRILFCCCVC